MLCDRSIRRDSICSNSDRSLADKGFTTLGVQPDIQYIPGGINKVIVWVEVVGPVSRYPVVNISGIFIYHPVGVSGVSHIESVDRPVAIAGCYSISIPIEVHGTDYLIEEQRSSRVFIRV